MKTQILSRRDFLKLAGVAAGGLVLVSCGGSGSGENRVRIMIDAWALSYAPFQEMAKRYNKLHPELEIKVEAGSNWQTKIVAQIRDNEVPWSAAGVMAPFLDLVAWNALGVIQPIDNYIAASTEEGASNFLSDMIPTILNDEKLDGKMYGIPFGLENICFLWNTDWYGKAGITEGPKTWQDLYDNSKSVKEVLVAEGNTETYPMAFDLGHLNRNVGSLFYSASDNPYTNDGWYNWDSDEMREALAFMRKLSRDGLTPPNCGEGAEIYDMWKRGRLAGLYSISSRGVWAQTELGFDKIIVSKAPTFDGKPHSGSAFWSSSIAIINKAPMPQQAVDFLIYACGPQNADWQKAVIKAGNAPAFNSVYDGQLQSDPELVPYTWMTDVRDQVGISLPAPKNYFYPIQNEAWSQHRPGFLKDDSTMTEDELIQKILQTSQEIYQTVLQSVPTQNP